MSSFNRVTLMGNLTRDPELRHTKDGKAVTDIGLAMNNRRKSGDDWIEDVVFVDVTIWGRTAENVCEYYSKGRSIFIEGRLKQDNWETDDGDKRSKLKIVGEKVIFLPNNKKNGNNSNNDSHNEEEPELVGASAGTANKDDDIPF